MPSNFVHVAEFIGQRIMRPIGQVSFWSYLVVAVLGLGGLGVWHAFLQAYYFESAPKGDVAVSLYTYFAALAGASIVQLTLDEDKAVRAAFQFFGFLLAGYGFVCFFFLNDGSDRAVYMGLGGVFFAVVIWWVANGDNSCLQDNIDPKDSIGGDETLSPSGDDEGYKT